MFTQAIEQFHTAIETQPDGREAHSFLSEALRQKGMFEEALAERKKLLALRGDTQLAEALDRGYEQGGYRGAMRLAAETLEARSDTTFVNPIGVAHFYADAGEKDQALVWLERAYQEHVNQLIFLDLDPWWHSLRSDPRFQSLLRRMNFPQ